MNNIIIFENKDFGQIRTIEADGQVWFVAVDVCNALGLSNPSMTVSRLDEDERAKFDLGRQGETNCVNEMGLYNLFLRSDKPEAKLFKRWITHEVLPSIYKHGGYMRRREEMSPEELMAKALVYADNKIKSLEGRLDSASIALSRLTVENEILTPKAEYFDELVDRNLLTSFRDTAKELKVKEKVFIQFLMDKKYLFRDKKGKLTPYANRKTDGLFEIRETMNEKTKWSGTQTLVTPKGRETFRLLLQGV